MDPCPFCAEPVDPEATKCAACGESLVERRPAVDPDRWGGANRPTSALVFAVLHIAFGVMGSLGLLLSLAMLRLVPNSGQFDPFAQMGEGFRVFQNVQMVLGGLANVVLIAAGVGLLRLREWARLASLGYAVFAIVAGLVGTAVTMSVVVYPMLQKTGQQQAMVFGVVGGSLGGCLGLLYPAAILFFLTRPHVVAAFRRAAGRG